MNPVRYIQCLRLIIENGVNARIYCGGISVRKTPPSECDHGDSIRPSTPCILDLAQHKKDSTLPAFYKSEYLEIRSSHEDHEALFTDGFKDEQRAGTAAYTNVETYSCQL